MSKTFILRAMMRSFTDPNIVYPIERDTQGNFCCGCPDWKHRRSKAKKPQDRLCKHLYTVLNSEDRLEKLFLMGEKFVLEIDGEKWEVSKDLTPVPEVKDDLEKNTVS